MLGFRWQFLKLGRVNLVNCELLLNTKNDEYDILHSTFKIDIFKDLHKLLVVVRTSCFDRSYNSFIFFCEVR